MSELSRPLALDRVGSNGVALTIEASAAESAAVAARLMIVSVPTLRCAFKVRRVEAGLFAADGLLEAEAEQNCVLSLDPFVQTIREAFTVHFVPDGEEDGDPEPDAVDQIPYAGSAVDLGEAAVEQLALALDPYPRKPGATLPAGLEPPSGPFAALLQIKPRLQD